jgi:hypothetical protein
MQLYESNVLPTRSIEMAKPESNALDRGDEVSSLAQILVPLKRRASVRRLIDGPVPKQTFWDPANKNTWHQNYPEMNQRHYDVFFWWARERGRDFGPGTPSSGALLWNAFHQLR